MTAFIPAWENGVLRPVEKLDVHKRGLRHKAVSVFVMAGDNLLIQRRAMEKYHTPGLWANTCCTHPHWEESAQACAIRRLREELNFEVELDHREQVIYRADVGAGLIEHEVVDIFLGRVPKPVPIAPNPTEVMDTRWVNLDDLHAKIAARPEKYTPWLKIYLHKYVEQIFGAPAHT